MVRTRQHTASGVDVRSLAHAALSKGVHRLLTHQLPSRWSRRGKGWQEVWRDATRAGFYASCDGMIVIAAARDFVDVDFDRAIEEVLLQHLTPFATRTQRAPDATAAQQRALVLTTTMKLAKYLQAYAAAGRPPAARRIAEQLANLLLKEGRRLQGAWAYVLGGTEVSVVATVEAALALRAAGVNDAIVDTACDQLAAIDWRQRLKEKTWTIRDLAMWFSGVCQLGMVPRQLSRQQMRACLRRLIASDEVFQFERWDDRFVNHRAKANDYYSGNITILTAGAILRMVEDRVLHRAFFRLVEPVIIEIATAIHAHEVFAPTGTLLFWENAQALHLLTQYLHTTETMAMTTSNRMLVAPRHFSTKRFVYDKKLVTILMPFGPEWSNDVYNALAKVIRNAKLRPWRADEDHSDDVIMQTIWERINESHFVVADCTGRNPNVFYELGIAHTIGKQVFICAQKRSDISFDVQSVRSATYRPTKAGITILKNALTKFIEELDEP